MPSDTVYITDVENEILSVFIKRKVLDNPTIIATLEQLVGKLEDDVTKVQLKRTQRGPMNPPLVVDDGFVRGSMKRMPTVGESMQFFHRHMDEGWIVTSPVVDIEKNGQTWNIRTKNSSYTLIRGWGTANENV